MKVKVPLELMRKNEQEISSDMIWELPEEMPEGFYCEEISASPPIAFVLREEHEDGSYRDLIFVDDSNKEY
jgi:hypothetical protein